MKQELSIKKYLFRFIFSLFLFMETYFKYWLKQTWLSLSKKNIFAKNS